MNVSGGVYASPSFVEVVVDDWTGKPTLLANPHHLRYY
jgi:hypothetical protein